MKYDEHFQARIHEASHAVIAYCEGRPIFTVEVAAFGKEGLVRTSDVPEFDRRYHQNEREPIAAVIRTVLAGPLALAWLEDGRGGTRTLDQLASKQYGGEVDISNARMLLELLTPGDEGVLITETASMLLRNWAAVQALALALREAPSGFLMGDQAAAVIEEALSDEPHALVGREPR